MSFHLLFLSSRLMQSMKYWNYVCQLLCFCICYLQRSVNEDSRKIPTSSRLCKGTTGQDSLFTLQYGNLYENDNDGECCPIGFITPLSSELENQGYIDRQREFAYVQKRQGLKMNSKRKRSIMLNKKSRICLIDHSDQIQREKEVSKT